MPSLEMLAEFIKGVGFPIFVAVFLLFRMEKAAKEVSHALNGLSAVIHAHFGPK